METYNEILNTMVERYESLSGHSINEQSDIMIRMKLLAGELLNTKAAVEFIKNQMFVLTASNDYLDKHALERGLNRKEAQKAVGEVTFRLAQSLTTDTVIEAGTVVATVSENPREFTTDYTVTIKAGAVAATVPCTAVMGGASYNVREKTVTVMVTPPLFVSSVSNEKAFKGGIDAESDEELRERILYSYQDISNGTNEVYYKRLAESVNGVYSASVVSKVRGPGTLNVYVCGKGDAKVNKDHIEQVQTLLDENRELNVDIEVLYAFDKKVQYVFTLEVENGYSFESVSDVVKEKITEYIDSLGVAKPALLCDVGDVIYHTQGVKNYDFNDAFCADTYPSYREYCSVEEITIREKS